MNQKTQIGRLQRKLQRELGVVEVKVEKVENSVNNLHESFDAKKKMLESCVEDSIQVGDLYRELKVPSFQFWN